MGEECGYMMIRTAPCLELYRKAEVLEYSRSHIFVPFGIKYTVKHITSSFTSRTLNISDPYIQVKTISRMTTQAAKGQQALANRDYDEAVTQYTAALKSANSPLWLISRSTAYQRQGKHDLALADADNAYLAATQRARRELMATAQFRRAVALHALKRYGDARLCLNWCRKLNEKEKALGMWQAKVTQDYETAEKEGRSDLISCTVKEVPDPVTEISNNSNDTKKDVKNDNTGASYTPAPAAVTPSQTPAEKIRHEWYQSSSKVTIMIFAKGVPKEKADVAIEEGSVSLNYHICIISLTSPSLRYGSLSESQAHTTTRSPLSSPRSIPLPANSELPHIKSKSIYTRSCLG
jgi:tetratricopeptide (TPR) repeat protein